MNKLISTFTFYVLLFFLLTDLFTYSYDCKAQSSGIQVGDQIRISAPTISKKRIIGNITFLTDQSIQISTVDGYQEIPYKSIKVLEITTEMRSHKWDGFFIGMLSGAAVGGSIAAITYSPCTSTWGDGWSCFLSPTSRTCAFGVGAGIGGFFGGLIGYGIGITKKSPKWERIEINPSMVWFPNQNRNNRYHPLVTVRWKLY